MIDDYCAYLIKCAYCNKPFDILIDKEDIDTDISGICPQCMRDHCIEALKILFHH